MLREKNLFISFKNVFFSLTLLCFTLFIALGNLPRLLESSLFTDHLLVSEMALYLLSLISLTFIKVSKRAWLGLGGFSLCTLASFLYGCSLQGMDLHAALYAGRLIAFYMASLAISSICFERFQGSISLFFSFLCKGYVISLVLGFLFFLFFPVSELLWQALSFHSVIFHGDPHVGRFVSVYFDPNYYAAIAGMPFLLTVYLYQKTKKRSFLVLSSLFLLSALLTWSRSGLCVLFFLLFFMFCSSYTGRFTSKQLKRALIGSFFLVFFSLFFFEEIFSFLERIFHVREDDSALSRLHTFRLGFSLFKERPLFGMGYNFLYGTVKEEIGLSSLDSSLLSLLVQIGAIPFLGLVFYGIYKGCFLKRAISRWKEIEKKAPKFLTWFIIYALLIVCFASQFNQLLFYPFWTLPFTIIALFLKNTIKKQQSC